MREILVGSDYSGVGAFDQALYLLGINFKKSFVCDYDQFARISFIENYGNEIDKKLLNNQEYLQLCKIVKNIIEGNREAKNNDSFLKQANEFSKKFSFYYPFNVYDREIPETPLDIYMTSPPCQAFSLAGNRKGEADRRGVLFYNSLEFISKNKPRYFIFENVKGLLSDDNGKTFARWLDLLGGKSINGNPVIFPHEDSVPYHIYHKVINAKDFEIPQNRERIFIIGVRDDADNNFSFPREKPLKKRLKDVLEDHVDKKYYLSEKMINGFHGINIDGISKTIRVGGRGSANDKHNFDLIKVGFINQDTQASSVYDENNMSPTICAGSHGYANGYIKIGALRGRNPDNPKSRKSGLETEQMLEINENNISNCLTTVQKDNLVVNNYSIRKLTPRECFRLMGFPDSFKIKVSDSQAYKQAGNSIVVNVLAELINKLKLD